MPNNPSKFQNIQLPAQSGDGFPSGVVEATGGTGGHIDGGSVTGAAKEGVERRGGDGEYGAFDYELANLELVTDFYGSS